MASFENKNHSKMGWIHYKAMHPFKTFKTGIPCQIKDSLMFRKAFFFLLWIRSKFLLWDRALCLRAGAVFLTLFLVWIWPKATANCFTNKPFASIMIKEWKGEFSKLFCMISSTDWMSCINVYRSQIRKRKEKKIVLIFWYHLRFGIFQISIHNRMSPK